MAPNPSSTRASPTPNADACPACTGGFDTTASNGGASPKSKIHPDAGETQPIAVYDPESVAAMEVEDMKDTEA